MNEITEETSMKFNYGQLDSSTANFLQKKEMKMRQIVGNAYTELGKELKETQEELAKHGYGCFEEWYTSLGFKRQTVYKIIQRYELILHNVEERNLIEDLPVSLTYEISKPSANHELKKKVLNGEIKSHKEYKALEQALKQTEERAKKAELESVHYQKLWNQEKNKPPKVVTKIETSIPDHIKKKIEEDQFKIKHLKDGYEEIKEKLKQIELQNTDEFDEKQAELLRKKRQHEADITTMNLRVAYKNFIEQGAISSYIHAAIIHANEPEKLHLREMVEMAEKVIHDTKLALNGRKLGVVNE